MKRWMRNSALAVVVFLVGCMGSLEHEPGHLQVTVALSEGALEVVETRAVSVPEHPQIFRHGIEWVFRPADGSEPQDGVVPDSRMVRSEFDEEGNPDPQIGFSHHGVVQVNVPSTAGTLELRGDDGTLLGSVSVDPEQPVTRRSSLLREGDILGDAVKIVSHGPSTAKKDILFLPEGYRERDLDQFRADVARIVQDLSRTPGYRENWAGFNVWRQDVRSRDRGIGGAAPRDTAFSLSRGATGLDRCVFPASNAAQQAVLNLGNRVGADVIVILANSNSHGGCQSGKIVTSTLPSYVSEVVAHELAHGLFGLEDEYDYGSYGEDCYYGVNVSRSPTSLPWADMVNTTRLPTPTSARRGTIGAFEGGGYCAQGRWRPTHTCMMKELGSDLCPVCTRHIHQTMASYLEDGDEPPSPQQPPVVQPPAEQPTVAAPTGLSPNGVTVPSAEAVLTWPAVAGATSYKARLQREVRGGWETFSELDLTEQTIILSLQPEGRRYRWSVAACDARFCSWSQVATFSYAGATSGGGSNGGSTESATPPATPTNLKPSDSGTSTDGIMSWSPVAGATHYNFKMVHDENGNWPPYTNTESVGLDTEVTVDFDRRGHWYAFAVQACNAAGCSEWTAWSRFYYQ